MFDSLQNTHQRKLLLAALDSDPEECEAFSTTVGTDDVSQTGYVDRLPVLLHHVHLPRLSAFGYIDWDRDSGTARRGPHFDEIEPLLRLLVAHADELPEDWP